MKRPSLLLLLCAALAACILPSCGHAAKSAQKYQVGLGLRVGWKDGGPYVGFQLLPVPPLTSPLSKPSSLDQAGQTFDALTLPEHSGGKTPVPAAPVPSSAGSYASPVT